MTTRANASTDRGAGVLSNPIEFEGFGIFAKALPAPFRQPMCAALQRFSQHRIDAKIERLVHRAVVFRRIEAINYSTKPEIAVLTQET